MWHGSSGPQGACCSPQSQPMYMKEGYNTPAKVPHSPLLYPLAKIDVDPSYRKYTISNWHGWVLQDVTDFKRFPFNNFTYCLTLFPKCFSSFPHGTCSLSVSRLYLALDGIYHPFWAAFPNNSTLWEHITKHWQSVSWTGFSPSMTLYSKRLVHSPMQKMLLQITTRTVELPDFKFELFPLHSQLLGESLLVSFPPLNDMLKFSG